MSRLIKRMSQYGRSDKRKDVKRIARKPGRRTSTSGRKYTERRRNRSDVNRYL